MAAAMRPFNDKFVILTLELMSAVNANSIDAGIIRSCGELKPKYIDTLLTKDWRHSKSGLLSALKKGIKDPSEINSASPLASMTENRATSCNLRFLLIWLHKQTRISFVE